MSRQSMLDKSDSPQTGRHQSSTVWDRNRQMEGWCARSTGKMELFGSCAWCRVRECSLEHDGSITEKQNSICARGQMNGLCKFELDRHPSRRLIDRTRMYKSCDLQSHSGANYAHGTILRLE